MNFDKMKPQETSEYMPPERHDPVQMDKLPESQLVDDNGKKFRTDDGGWVPNNTFVLDGKTCKADDSGNVYQQDGKYFPNDFFVVDGLLYLTDENGELVFDDVPPEPEKVSLEGTEQGNPVLGDFESGTYPCERIMDGEKYCYDSNGSLYRVGDQLLPNSTYELNGNIYTTDEIGRIISCEAKPVRSPENPRDNEAQRQAGGKDRRPNDQGGHIVGRDMNGDGGLGNLVAMDSKINQSDYKRMENDIKAALDEGKEVTTKTEMTYSGDSERPDKITVTVTTDGKDTVYEFDNNLDGSLDNEISEKSPSAKAIIDEHPGAHVSSVKREYDENGNLIKTTAYITWTDEDGNNRRSPIIVPND